MFQYQRRRARENFELVAWIMRIAYMVPMALVYLAVYLGRRVARWYVAQRARSWPAANARVCGSYDIDENESALSLNGWFYDDDGDVDVPTVGGEHSAAHRYHARFAVAIQYTYHADGELRTGTYFLPETYTEGDVASDAEKSWEDRKIVVRYNPSKPEQSAFLVQDGAPGKPHIPRALSRRPYLNDLSLK